MERVSVLIRHLTAPQSGSKQKTINTLSDDAFVKKGFPPELKNPVYKPRKYHHFKDEKIIETIVRNPVVFEQRIPRLRIPEETLKTFPEYIRQTIEWGRNWAVLSDGEFHRTLRRSFPKEFMVYDLTKRRNSDWARSETRKLLDKIVERERHKEKREFDVMEDLGSPLALELLCKVLGFKNATEEWKGKMRLYATRSSDTGYRFTMAENCEIYLDGHIRFRSILKEVADCIKINDDSKYDLDAVMGRMIKKNLIKDFDVMADQCHMWVLGGFHNPSNLICLTVGLMLEHDAQLRKVKKMISTCDRSEGIKLMHCISQEVLRLHPPAHVIVRFCSKDIEVGGKRIRKGDGVICHLETSNRRQVSGNINEFNVFRPELSCLRHLAFSRGRHRCMGGETGQLCAEIVLEELLRHPEFQNLELAAFDWHKAGSFKEIDDIRIRF